MPRPVFFQHLRKTAGTSLADTLRLFFRPESTAAVDSQLHDSESIDDTSARLRSYDLVTGHADILSIASSDSFKVAVFRDPFQRLLSERRQWMQAGPENLAAASPAIASATLLLQQRSIVDILDSVYDHPAMVPGFWNHQALTLGAWPLLRMERRLQRASAFRWSNMHEHFDSASELRSWLI